MFTSINMKSVFGLAYLVSIVLSLPQTTRPPISTESHPPPVACVVDGKIYHDSETISRDPENCYFSRCSGGSVMYGDDRCFLMGQPHCNGQLVDIPGQCCHECRESTNTTPSTTTSAPIVYPGACVVNGHVYMPGEDISRDRENCYGMICKDKQAMNWDAKCFLIGQPDCPNGHLVDIPGQCCHECIEDVTTVPSAIVG